MKRTFLAIALLLLSGSVFAQSFPQTMNFQGRLAKPDGTAVSDGLYTAVFSIYDAPTGGNLVWSQVFTGMKAHYGVFAVLLGDSSGLQGAIPPSGPLNASLFAGNRWLQVQLGGTSGPLMPRQQFLPTAYAFLAGTVSDNAITTAKIADGAVTASKLAPGLLGTTSGMAGGDLIGTYPNPLLALNAVTTGKIADSAVATSKLADNSVNGVKLISDFASLNKVSGGTMSATGSQINILQPLTVSGMVQSSAGGFMFPDGTVQTTAAQNLSPGFLTAAPSLSLVSTTSTLTPSGGGYNPKIMAVSGNYAYVLNGSLLQVFDVSTASTPVLKGSIGANAFGSGWVSMAISGSIVAALSGANLELFDVSNPSNPVLKGALNSALGYGWASVAIAGNYAYVVDYASMSLQVFDINNPANPNLVGTVGLTNSPQSLAVSGNYAYVVSGNSRLTIYDVSNPANPVASGSVTVVPNGYISVSGKYAYVVGNRSNGVLQVIDVGNPASPTLLSTVTVGTNASYVAVSASYVYVINSSNNYILAYDVSDPSNPLPKIGVETGDQPEGIVVSGNSVYVVNYAASTLQIFSPSMALRVKSNLVVNGTVLADGFVSTSDARYKTNLAPLNNALDDVMNLRGVSYDFDREKWPAKNFPEGRQVGFIAQELENVLPELVHTDADGYKSVMYQNVAPVLVEAVKTQQKQIETLKADNAQLKKQLAAILARLAQVEAAQKADKSAQK